jgi:hypothetical protein
MNQIIINNKKRSFLKNGKCGICGKRIRFVEEDGILLKTRLFKFLKKGGCQIKCPNCKAIINF